MESNFTASTLQNLKKNKKAIKITAAILANGKIKMYYAHEIEKVHAIQAVKSHHKQALLVIITPIIKKENHGHSCEMSDQYWILHMGSFFPHKWKTTLNTNQKKRTKESLAVGKSLS